MDDDSEFEFVYVNNKEQRKSLSQKDIFKPKLQKLILQT